MLDLGLSAVAIVLTGFSYVVRALRLEQVAGPELDRSVRKVMEHLRIVETDTRALNEHRVCIRAALAACDDILDCLMGYGCNWDIVNLMV